MFPPKSEKLNEFFPFTRKPKFIVDVQPNRSANINRFRSAIKLCHSLRCSGLRHAVSIMPSSSVLSSSRHLGCFVVASFLANH